MKNARNGHNHSSQAWYNRTTNLKFECFYTLLVRGRLPLRPRIKKEKESAKIQENYLLKKIGGTLPMATTKIFPIHADVEGALAYITNPEKTDNGRLVYAFGCSEKPSRAARDFVLKSDHAEAPSSPSTLLSASSPARLPPKGLWKSARRYARNFWTLSTSSC